VPDKDSTVKLQGVISTLANRFDSPSFPPHITLVTVPSDTNVDALVHSIPCDGPIQVLFESVTMGATFFQSVFIAIHASEELLALQRTCARQLNVDDTTMPHFPHLSLFYGIDKKLEVKAHLEEERIVANPQDGRVAFDGLHGFLATEVWVARCDGPVDEWQVVTKVAL